MNKNEKEKTMKSELIRTISLYDTIILHRHVRPDPDAYGSQCGLGRTVNRRRPGQASHVYVR